MARLEAKATSKLIRQNIFHDSALEQVEVYAKYEAIPSTRASRRYDYFSVRNEPLQKVDDDNLRLALQDNRKSLDLLKQYRNYKRAGLILFGAGITTAQDGLVKSARETKRTPTGEYTSLKLNSTCYIGLGVMLSGFIPFSLKDPKLKRAIDVYNQY